MRLIATVAVCASLAACDAANSETAITEAPQDITALTYDGADYGSDQAAMVAHGERLSKVLLCAGCHNADFTGNNWGDMEPGFDGIYASNLTHVLPQMSDEDLRSLLRTGEHPTRGDMYIMPSMVYQHVSDADLDAVIAYLRTLEVTGEATPPPDPNGDWHDHLESGELRTSAEELVEHRDNVPPDLGSSYARGRYIAMTTCAECHGATLSGVDGFSPDLDIAGMYSHDQLTHLLTTGEGLETSELGLMAEVSAMLFSQFTDAERAAVVNYVKARADANMSQ